MICGRSGMISDRVNGVLWQSYVIHESERRDAGPVFPCKGCNK